jgi:hypothetical protein
VTVYITPPAEVGLIATPPEPVEVTVTQDGPVEIEVTPLSVGGFPTEGPVDEFIHHQSTPAASWDIQHNLATKPEVRFFLEEAPEERVYTDVTYSDLNNIVATWPEPKSGWAYIR